MVFYVYLAHIQSQQIIFVGKYQVKYTPYVCFAPFLLSESGFRLPCIYTRAEFVNGIRIQIQTRFCVNKQTLRIANYE